jgi:hypothetical protein
VHKTNRKFREAGGSGDAADTDLGAAVQGIVDRLDDALASPGGVGATPLGHGVGGGR